MKIKMSITIDKDLIDRIREKADREDRTFSGTVNRIIKTSFLKDKWNERKEVKDADKSSDI